MWIDMHASHEIVSSETAFETRVSSEEGGGRLCKLDSMREQRCLLAGRLMAFPCAPSPKEKY